MNFLCSMNWEVWIHCSKFPRWSSERSARRY